MVGSFTLLKITEVMLFCIQKNNITIGGGTEDFFCVVAESNMHEDGSRHP
jgi:hypothetical protein